MTVKTAGLCPENVLWGVNQLLPMKIQSCICSPEYSLAHVQKEHSHKQEEDERLNILGLFFNLEFMS